MLSARYLNLIQRISAIADTHNRQVFVVGGVVRDLLRGVAPGDADVDFLVDTNGIEFAQICAKELRGVAKSFPPFLTAKVLAPAELPEIAELDFATARKEIYRVPGALPSVVPATIEEDLGRRDFTINAMAIPTKDLLAVCSSAGGVSVEKLRTIVRDPFQGQADLDARLVRALHPKSFSDDPTRIFRACRYASRIEGSCAPETREQILNAIKSGAFDTISPQRKLNEMKHVIAEGDPARVVRLLVDSGVFRAFELFDPLNVELVGAALMRLSTAKGHVSVDLREKAAMRIFYAYADHSIRESVFEEFALGKKIVKRIQDDVAALYGEESLHTLSVEALTFIGVMKLERADEAIQLLASHGIQVTQV